MAAACATRPVSPSPDREVFVIGTLHRWHLVARYRYSLADLGAEVEALRPDLVCGEVTPEHFSGALEGLYPPEVAVVREASARVGAVFVPADWRGDYAEVFRAERRMDAAQKERFDHAHDELMARLAAWEGASLFDFIGDAETQSLVARAHATRIEYGNQAADGFWTTRNAEIVRRCLASSRWATAKRAVFAFGMEHTYAIERVLLAEHGIRASKAPRLFTPSNSPASQAVLREWVRHRDALKALEGDPAIEPALRERVIASGRVHELGLFIESRGVSR